jgi:membrane protein required for beta-lactamase induction
MTPPDWLIPILQQFPIVALVFGVMIVVVRWMDTRHRDDRADSKAESAEVRRRADAEIARARQDKDQAASHVAAEIARIEGIYRSELAAARRRVRELERRERSGEGR